MCRKIHVPEIPAFKQWRQERGTSEASLGYVRPCLKKKVKKIHTGIPNSVFQAEREPTVCPPATVSATITKEISSVPAGSLHVLQVLSP